MGITGISWTGTRLREALRIARDIRVDDKVFLARGTYGPGSVVDGFTFNPWIGCERVSEACKHCYAEVLASGRMGYGNPDHKIVSHRLPVWGPAATTPRDRTSPANWQRPLKYEVLAQSLGVQLKVFCGSLCDIGEDHPAVRRWREDLFALVERTPHLTWLLLTKRPEVLADAWPWKRDVQRNAWAGITAENQRRANERVPHLLGINSITHWLSCEPLLGEITLAHEWTKPRVFSHCPDEADGEEDACRGCVGDPRAFGPGGDPCGAVWTPRVDWVIGGGGSGEAQEPPMDLGAFYGLADQCRERGVAFYPKQDSGAVSGLQGRIPDEMWSAKAWPEVSW